MDSRERLVTALQLGDSFFPSGAFAYSCGLETYVSEGLVCNKGQLVLFIECYLVGLVARADALFLKLSYGFATEDDVREILRLDHLIHAMKLSKELRTASMQMGRQVLEVMKDLYPSSLTEALLRSPELKGHHPVMFGAVCGSIGLGVENTLLTYLYATVSSLVSAGLRLIPLGHSDGQRAINELKRLITRIAKDAEQLGEPDIASFAPAIEIRAMQHEHLPVRLFRS